MANNYPKLERFSKEGEGLQPEEFGSVISKRRDLVSEVVCFSEPGETEKAEVYSEVIGREFRHETAEDPLQAAREVDQEGVVPLVLTSAIDPELKEKFFRNPDFGKLFADHNYVLDEEHAGLLLNLVGTTRHGLERLKLANVGKRKEDLPKLIAERSEKIKEVLGKDVFTYADLRKALQSLEGQQIRVHALGPDGTNISQVAREYVYKHAIQDQSEILIHPRGVEPFEYAEQARQEKEQGLSPLHIECAVFYGMRDLYEQRKDENVFADHHYMALDEMQIASKMDWEDILGRDSLRIASHPSPKSLMADWFESGRAEWIKATSNSAAADMVANDEVDACITTEKGREASALRKKFSFGSPTMIFTLGTPLDKADLES